MPDVVVHKPPNKIIPKWRYVIYNVELYNKISTQEIRIISWRSTCRVYWRAVKIWNNTKWKGKDQHKTLLSYQYFGTFWPVLFMDSSSTHYIEKMSHKNIKRILYIWGLIFNHLFNFISHYNQMSDSWTFEQVKIRVSILKSSYSPRHDKKVK